ncbi:receptor-like serine/threonine-protein kinase SD1-8 isoform X1 [Canna indica]|uniref:Receptor-like serine/threonine-protein kinase n=1 Tax=Canna indica TaxID=4628 RepID=A0AAQ3KQ18_9LILI|nr:receptor-like serine/threonine-protein kinase SD1-8 isoform X1 [Canna indica]
MERVKKLAALKARAPLLKPKSDVIRLSLLEVVSRDRSFLFGGNKMVVIELLLMLAISLAVHGQSGDTISPNQSLVDGDTLTSAHGIFELGFFSPPKSNSRYLGIWYKNIALDNETIWVANKGKPLTSSDGVLNLTRDGNLILLDNSGNTLWSTGITNIVNPVVQLRDSGNLVVSERDSNTIKWQTFDYPCDTLLPSMKLGISLGTNFDRHLTSWKSDSDLSPGDYTYQMNPQGVPELFLRKGNAIIYRSGPWNGNGFSGRPDMQENKYFKFNLVSNQDMIYYTYEDLNSSILSRIVLTSDGKVRRFISYTSRPGWSAYWVTPKDDCDTYSTCGNNGVCSSASIPCQCLNGTVAKDQTEWSLRNFTSGCVRQPKNLSCQEIFQELPKVKLPDSSQAISVNRSPEECKCWCLRNSSCMAYSMVEENMCITWTNDLIDIRTFIDGKDSLYVRVGVSEQDCTCVKEPEPKPVFVIVVPVVLGFLFLVCVGLFLCWRNQRRIQVDNTAEQNSGLTMTDSRIEASPRPEIQQTGELRAIGIEGSSANAITNNQSGGGTERSTTTSNFSLDNTAGRVLGIFPSYNLCTIEAATCNFSITNRLGEGAFGIVYKGQLGEGEKVAVKRLKHLAWSAHEFKNELLLIANLQHKNLVCLLGYCIEGNERILILEYMENRSLDIFIYDKEKSILLNCQKRLDIIIGIARGLQYLHQDCNKNVVHRDLKLSNILLDEEMNPKICDFGISRFFEGDKVQERFTTRPMGTIGYMAPEYASYGRFSFKSDVFSFGVLVLEILSGKKNLGMVVDDKRTDLTGYAYRLWREGRSFEILDDVLKSSVPPIEVIRFIRVGLLCVQENNEDRPRMAEVVMMLSSQDVLINSPKPPKESMILTQGDMASSSPQITSMTTGR